MKVTAINRRARFEYEILETMEAGMMLTGPEAKSCRMGHVDLSGAYLSFLGGAAVLKQFKILPYRYATTVPHEIIRDRRLLLSATQLERMRASITEKGISVIPLEIRAGKYVKVLLGIGRGRKKADKRAAIKERDVKRRIREGREI